MRSGVHVIWGSNTGVGKTLVSAGLMAAARRRACAALYLKPAQTGFLTDADGGFADGLELGPVHGEKEVGVAVVALDLLGRAPRPPSAAERALPALGDAIRCVPCFPICGTGPLVLQPVPT